MELQKTDATPITFSHILPNSSSSGLDERNSFSTESSCSSDWQAA